MKARRRGSIYPEPGSKTWTIAYRRDGRRVREYGFRDYKAAQQRLTQRLAQGQNGEAIDTGRGPTCTDLWEGLERHYRINGRKSAECLPRRWKHLEPSFGGVAAGQVTFDRLEQYIDARLAEHASNATINRELSALKTAFRLGRKKQAIGTTVPIFRTSPRTTCEPGLSRRRNSKLSRPPVPSSGYGCFWKSPSLTAGGNRKS